MATKRVNNDPLKFNPNQKHTNPASSDDNTARRIAEEMAKAQTKQARDRAEKEPAPVTKQVRNASNPKLQRKSYSNPTRGNDDSVKVKKPATDTLKKVSEDTSVMTKVSNKTSPGKPTKKSFTKSKKNVSIEKTSTKKTLKKAFDAAAVMKERRAKAMANRDSSKNPNNVNLRGIVKTKKKGKK